MGPLLTKKRATTLVAAAALAVAGAVNVFWHPDVALQLGPGAASASAERPDLQPGARRDPDSVELADSQLASVKVEPVQLRDFPIEKQAVGTIAFNDEVSVQVFTPYQGRIIGSFAKLGDDVRKGMTLFTIDSPDLLQAESTLIAAAGVLEFTTRNLSRLKELYATRAISQKDLEQATSDQQTAEGALRAARDSVRLFGKTDDQIERIVSQRMADPTLVVPCPINGRITARNAAPGLFVQPGNAPAPFTVTDVDSMWMLANVAETDSPSFGIGQSVEVHVNAFPDRLFHGTVTTVGSMVDPNTRRVLVRSEVADPQHDLRSGMFATFVIRIGAPVRSPAIPLDGVVREGDGTMTVWATTDRRLFKRRTVKIGLQSEGYRQILEGTHAGELVATEGALFLSNALATASR